ncbi:MAG: protein phosphatase CheZ [Proteobacteria bacterium]|nr:protein phosphatase CheZ [Pseudomonadota bacterium]
MSENLPVIRLELNSGVFKIKTEEAIYHISVSPDSSLSRVVEKVVETESARQTVPALDLDVSSADLDDFYREVSEEMYTEIGQLARKLSLSIKDIPGEAIHRVDIERTGRELEEAKGQLEDIVQMTEKATMDIMDLAESIQDDCSSLVDQLQTIKDLEFVQSGAASDDDWDDEPAEASEPAQAPLTDQAAIAVLSAVIETETGLREAVSQLPVAGEADQSEEPEPEAEAQPEPQPQKITTYEFETDVVFQTLYEFCTNEAVKDHIKAMRAEQETAFDQAAVLKTLTDLAPTVTVEDNFFNFPIVAILKSLFQATNNDKFKATLKKMNQTAGNIFLDAVLPLEGRVEEKEIPAPAKAPAAAPKPAGRPGLPQDRIDALLALIDENLSRLEAEKARLEEAGPAASSSGSAISGDLTTIKIGDRDLIINAVELSSELIHRVMARLTSILEALSFQDLSGQRIFKIVRLIGDIQVQLLSLLVSFGAKLKKKQQEAKAVISSKDADKLAQEEVDKMLERISSPSDLKGPESEGRLDQDAVNQLLGDLGF